MQVRILVPQTGRERRTGTVCAFFALTDCGRWSKIEERLAATMRPIISLITAFAVLLHLVLGCCAHHAHGQSHANCTHEDPATSHTGGCHAGHCHDQEAPVQPSEPVVPPYEDCHDSHCAFHVASALTFVPDVTVVYAVITDQSPAGQLVSLRRTSTRERGDPVEPAVRPHLAYQVFLN